VSEFRGVAHNNALNDRLRYSELAQSRYHSVAQAMKDDSRSFDAKLWQESCFIKPPAQVAPIPAVGVVIVVGEKALSTRATFNELEKTKSDQLGMYRHFAPAGPRIHPFFVVALVGDVEEPQSILLLDIGNVQLANLIQTRPSEQSN
jgi:hypothetical protein